MDMKQCSAGHFYDAERYDACPYCNENYSPLESEPKVVDRQYEESSEFVTRPLEGSSEFKGMWDPDDGVTTPLEDTGFNPVVGWLVCVDGPDKGASFEIHNENNYIGRSPSLDINIPSDKTISRDKPVVITYDSRSRSFYCAFVSGKSIVRLNDTPLLSTVQLKRNDIIELGRTKLMFIPLCGESFDWNWNE